MPEMILNRDYVLRTTKGHTIGFAKGVPSHVPANCVEDAMAVGAVYPDGSTVEVKPAPEGPVAPTDPKARKAEVFAAFDRLVARSAREDFTAAGSPTKYALEREVKWYVDAKERTLMWDAYKTARGGAED